MSSGNAPIYLNEDNEDDEGLMGPSDSDDDDDEERLDCVHDIHGDGEEADVDEIDDDDECDFATEQQVDMADEMDNDRPLIHDNSMDGDIEDADGNDTERRIPKRPSLFNKLTGAE